MKVQTDNWRIVLIPQIDAGAFDLRLPSPDSLNTGGYMIPTSKGTIYSYSPIDLAVASLEAKRLHLIPTDLQRFFTQNKFRLSETLLHLGFAREDTVYIYSITQWKVLMNDPFYSGIIPILKTNAPLTMR